MSDLQIDVLRVLRIFGPCSNADVGRRLGIAPDKTYPVVSELVRRGLAVHPRLQRWDISEEGRHWFADQGPPMPQLFMEAGQ